MKQRSRFLPLGLLLLLGAAAVAYLAGAPFRSQAVQNPTIHMDMFTVGNTYNDETNTMTVGSVDSSLVSANSITHSHPTQLVIKDVEDLVGFNVRLNYIGDKMRPWLFNPTPFADNIAGQGVSFLNLPIDQTIAAHRDLTDAVSIPGPPPDGSNTQQTALIGVAYDGSPTFAVSPDTPHKSIPDDGSYDAPTGGILGNLILQVIGDECGQTMLMDLDDGLPNSPGSEATIFTGSGTTTINLTESQLFDGIHSETCPTPSPTPSPTPTPVDSDQDGWSDNGEGVIGTDAFDGCADNPTDDAWPADINNDTFVDVIGDIVTVANHFGGSVPPAPSRYNVAPDPPDGYIDVLGDMVRLAGLFGTSCAPPLSSGLNPPPHGPAAPGAARVR